MFTLFENPEKKRSRLLAIEEKAKAAERARIAKDTARREGWKQFWFNLRLTIGLFFGIPIAGIVILAVVGSFLPRSNQPYSQPPLKPLISQAPPMLAPIEKKVSPKPVHVKAYVKQDGTHVGAHVRGEPSKKK